MGREEELGAMLMTLDLMITLCFRRMAESEDRAVFPSELKSSSRVLRNLPLGCARLTDLYQADGK